MSYRSTVSFGKLRTKIFNISKIPIFLFLERLPTAQWVSSIFMSNKESKYILYGRKFKFFRNFFPTISKFLKVRGKNRVEKFPKISRIYFSCLRTTQAFPRNPGEFNPIQFLFKNDIFILILYLINVRGLYKTRFVWKEIKLC